MRKGPLAGYWCDAEVAFSICRVFNNPLNNHSSEWGDSAGGGKQIGVKQRYYWDVCLAELFRDFDDLVRRKKEEHGGSAACTTSD